MCPVTGYLVHPPARNVDPLLVVQSKTRTLFLKRRRQGQKGKEWGSLEEVENMIGENLSQKETQFGYMLLLLIASGWKCHELPMYHSSLMTMHPPHCYRAPGALCMRRALSRRRAPQRAVAAWNRVATIDGNWTGVDDNYPPNNCFPLKQDWKLPTKCVRLQTTLKVVCSVYVTLKWVQNKFFF